MTVKHTKKSGAVEEGRTMTDGLDFDRFGDLLLACSQHGLTADF